MPLLPGRPLPPFRPSSDDSHEGVMSFPPLYAVPHLYRGIYSAIENKEACYAPRSIRRENLK
jgi:hypothetical protein